MFHNSLNVHKIYLYIPDILNSTLNRPGIKFHTKRIFCFAITISPKRTKFYSESGVTLPCTNVELFTETKQVCTRLQPCTILPTSSYYQ